MLRIYLFLVTTIFLNFSCKEVVAQSHPLEIDTNDYMLEYGANDVNTYYFSDNSKMNGTYIVKRDSVVQEEFSTKNGLLNGNYKYYFPNGVLANEVIYVRGKKNGDEKWYFKSGKLKKIEHFENNVLVGKSSTYHEDGTLYMEKSKIDGRWASKIYRNDKVVAEEYDVLKGDKLIGISKIYDSSGATKISVGFIMIDNIMKDDIMYLMDEHDNIIDSINPQKDKIKAMQLMLMVGKGMN